MSGGEHRKLNWLMLVCRHAQRDFMTVHFGQVPGDRCIYLRSPVTVIKPFVPSRWVPSRDSLSRSV